MIMVACACEILEDLANPIQKLGLSCLESLENLANPIQELGLYRSIHSIMQNLKPFWLSNG